MNILEIVLTHPAVLCLVKFSYFFFFVSAFTSCRFSTVMVNKDEQHQQDTDCMTNIHTPENKQIYLGIR